MRDQGDVVSRARYASPVSKFRRGLGSLLSPSPVGEGQRLPVGGGKIGFGYAWRHVVAFAQKETPALRHAGGENPPRFLRHRRGCAIGEKGHFREVGHRGVFEINRSKPSGRFISTPYFVACWKKSGGYLPDFLQHANDRFYPPSLPAARTGTRVFGAMRRAQSSTVSAGVKAAANPFGIPRRLAFDRPSGW